MMRYEISCENPYSQFIKITIYIHDITENTTCIRLAAWRPGRYELGNFAKNVRGWKAMDENGNTLPAHKSEKERWVVDTTGVSNIKIEYDYYAGILNAGSTYVDENQLYMNPVNCCCYVEGRENDGCEMVLVVPDDYIVATGLQKREKHVLYAGSFDELADRPLIASAKMKHYSFFTQNLDVHLWFMGECKPDEKRLLNDFKAFIDEQIDAYGSFPEPEYHFLFQITPHKTHHGVEHENSTVCMMGPSYHLFGASYDEFLGLSSHEFYHSWNIKKIRPAEMMPYDFTKENYSKLGYVAEGVTTYYGDIMCYRSKVYDRAGYLATLDELLEKHFHNYGRFFMPVSEASFDTWIDGYEAGVPHRKTSIYTEGALCALMTDIYLLDATNGKYSLDTVMKDLYTEFAQKGKGYTELDYKTLIEKYMGRDYTWFFERYIWGCEDFTDELKQALRMVGIEFYTESNNQLYEKNYGCRISEDSLKITQVAPGSPAEKYGLIPGEVVASVNGFTVTGNNMKHWFVYFKGEEVTLRLRTSDNRIRHVNLPAAENDYYPQYVASLVTTPDERQKNMFTWWAKNPW